MLESLILSRHCTTLKGMETGVEVNEVCTSTVEITSDTLVGVEVRSSII